MGKTYVVVSALVAALLASCATYKPARVLFPETFGLSCPDRTLCVETPESLPAANRLRLEAIDFVERTFGASREPPRVLFCSTEACFAKFGDPRVRAQNVGRQGIVINDSGWEDYTVRHEMIHHWQNEQFGVLMASVVLPRWYIEGMAYSLSEDPRRPLPHPDAEAYRARFEA